MKPPSQTETDLPPPPFGGAQGAAHRFAQDLNRARYRTSDPEQLLGEGGIGRVIIAEETLLRRPVAMKTLREDRAGELYEARLIREARITGLLEHPSIVPVHDIGRNDDSKIYYTMKKVVGLTLREVIEHLRPATVDTTDEAKALRESVQKRFGSIPARLGLFQKVCDAIAFAHAHPLRVIHRDLKPENIMVGEFGEVLVMDWGLAKVLATDEESLYEALPLESGDQTSHAGFTVSRIALSTAGQFVGTPMYAAPEQLEGRLEDIDEKSDVYALGGVLYHLLTLEPPISGESKATAEDKSPNAATQTATTRGSAPDWDALVRFIRGGHVAPLLRERTGSKSIPEALCPLLQRALAPGRSQRIASVSALQQAISQFLAGYANAFEQAGAWRHFVYFVKRHKGVALASAAALIIIASLTAGFTRRVTHEKERAQAEAERATKAETETTKQLVETNRQLERVHLEQGKTLIEKAESAGSKGNNLTALMLAGKAHGFQGAGRQANEAEAFADRFPLLLGAQMTNRENEKERGALAARGNAILTSGIPTFLPLWRDEVPHDESPILDVACSQDGRFIASTSSSGIKVWDAKSGALLHQIDQKASWLEFSPDGNVLATCGTAVGSAGVTLINPELGVVTKRIGTKGTSAMAFHPDGIHLADLAHGVWDINSGTLVKSGEFGAKIATKANAPPGSSDFLMSIAISPDGKWLATGSYTGTIRLHQTTDYALVKELNHEGFVHQICFSHDSASLFSASRDERLLQWNVTSGSVAQEVGKYGVGNSPQFYGRLFLSTDEQFLVSSSDSGSKKIITLSDRSERDLPSLGMSAALLRSRPNTMIVTDGHRLVHWDMQTNGVANSSPSQNRAVVEPVFSADGLRVVHVSPVGICVRDTSTGKVVSTIPFGEPQPNILHTSISLNAELERVAVCYREKDTLAVRVFDVAQQRELTHFVANGSIAQLSPDATLLATKVSKASDHRLEIRDAATGKILSKLEIGAEIHQPRFTDDSSTLIVQTSQSLSAWAVKEGRKLASLTTPQTDYELCPHTSIVAIASEDRKSQTIWDWSKGKVVAKILSDDWHVTFSPDGNYFVTHSFDGQGPINAYVVGSLLNGIVSPWKIPMGKQVRSVRFSPDASILAASIMPPGPLGATDVRNIELFEVSDMTRPISLGSIHTSGPIDTLSFDPISTRLLVTSRTGSLEMVDLAGQCQAPKRIVGEIQTVAFSPDGKFMANRCGGPNGVSDIFVRDSLTNLTLHQFTWGIGHLSLDTPRELRFSEDSRWLCSVGDKTELLVMSLKHPIRQFKVTTPGEISELIGIDGNSQLQARTRDAIVTVDLVSGKVVNSKSIGKLATFATCTVSEKGELIAGYDPGNLTSARVPSTICIFDTPRTAVRFTKETTHAVQSMQFSVDATKLAISYKDAPIEIWSTESGAVIETTGQEGSNLRFSADGNYLAFTTGNYTASIWDMRAGVSAGNYSLRERTGAGHVADMAFSPNSQNLLIASSDYPGADLLFSWHFRESLDLAAWVRSGAVRFEDDKVVFGENRNLFSSGYSLAPSGALPAPQLLSDTDLPQERRLELEMQQCIRLRQWSKAVELWKQAGAESPIKGGSVPGQLYLTALTGWIKSAGESEEATTVSAIDALTRALAPNHLSDARIALRVESALQNVLEFKTSIADTHFSKLLEAIVPTVDTSFLESLSEYAYDVHRDEGSNDTQTNRAREFVKRCLTQAPSSTKLKAYLVGVLEMPTTDWQNAVDVLLADPKSLPGDFTSAALDAVTAATQKPSPDQPLIKKADQWRQLALIRFPKDAAVMENEGWCKLALNDPTSALQAFKAAATLLAEVDAVDVPLRAGLSIASYLTGDQTQAKAHYLELIRADLEWATAKKVAAVGGSKKYAQALEKVRQVVLKSDMLGTLRAHFENELAEAKKLWEASPNFGADETASYLEAWHRLTYLQLLDGKLDASEKLGSELLTACLGADKRWNRAPFPHLVQQAALLQATIQFALGNADGAREAVQVYAQDAALPPNGFGGRDAEKWNAESDELAAKLEKEKLDELGDAVGRARAAQRHLSLVRARIQKAEDEGISAATTQGDLMTALWDTLSAVDSLNSYRELLPLAEETLAFNEKYVEVDETARLSLAWCHNTLGYIQLNLGNARQSLTHFNQASEVLKTLKGDQTKGGQFRDFDLQASYGATCATQMQGDLEEARRLGKQMIELTQRYFKEVPGEADLALGLVNRYELMATIEWASHRDVEAIEWLKLALKEVETWHTMNPDVEMSDYLESHLAKLAAYAGDRNSALKWASAASSAQAAHERPDDNVLVNLAVMDFILSGGNDPSDKFNRLIEMREHWDMPAGEESTILKSCVKWRSGDRGHAVESYRVLQGKYPGWENANWLENWGLHPIMSSLLKEVRAASVKP